MYPNIVRREIMPPSTQPELHFDISTLPTAWIMEPLSTTGDMSDELGPKPSSREEGTLAPSNNNTSNALLLAVRVEKNDFPPEPPPKLAVHNEVTQPSVTSTERPVPSTGSTWLAPYDGQWWPVVLCNDTTILSQGFKYKAGEKPAILLGHHKCIRVIADTLREYDPSVYSQSLNPSLLEPGDVSATIQLRQRAFWRDAPEYHDDKWWSSYIQTESITMETERTRRRGSSSAATSRSKRNSICDGDVVVVRKRRRKSSSTSTIAPTESTPSRDSHCNAEAKHPYQLVSSRKTPAIQQAYSIRTKRVELIDGEANELDAKKDDFLPPHSKIRNQTITPSKTRRQQRPKARRQHPLAPPVMKCVFSPCSFAPNRSDKHASRDHCRIVLGNNTYGTIINRAALESCKYLANQEYYDPTINEHIINLNNCPRAAALGLTEKELTLIYEYFHTNDIGPVVLVPGSAPPLVPLNAAQKSDHVNNLSAAFLPASKIQHYPLQRLIAKKLNALYPIPLSSLLTCAERLSSLPPAESDAEYFLQAWVIDGISDSFYALARDHGTRLQSLLAKHTDLREAVLQNLIADGQSGRMEVDE